jgi:hypothetical protein
VSDAPRRLDGVARAHIGDVRPRGVYASIMRSQHRHRSQEIIFRGKVADTIQKFFGGTGASAVLNGRAITSAFFANASPRPLYARFLEKPSTGGGD